jgi:hypothetical protein
MAVQFQDVQNILKNIIANWTKGNGAPPNLLGRHQTTLFAWDTKDELLKSTARGLPLIQPDIIGKAGQGATANLIVSLTKGVGAFPPMPDGGLDSQNGVFLTLNSPEIHTIITWIEAGCP